MVIFCVSREKRIDTLQVAILEACRVAYRIILNQLIVNTSNQV